jgi:organic radical activating enzyme
MTPSEIVDYWSEQGWFGHLLGGAHLILTGGEPTLWQPQLTVLLELVAQNCGSHHLKMPWVEVETNATIPLVHEFDFWVNQYNCSPKLRSAGNDRMKSYVPLVLREHALKTHKSIFKFVVQDLEKDVEEILYDYVVPFEIREDRVYLMPEGATRERLLERSEAVAELCKKYGFNFSSRLQLMLWNKATGV